MLRRLWLVNKRFVNIPNIGRQQTSDAVEAQPDATAAESRGRAEADAEVSREQEVQEQREETVYQAEAKENNDMMADGYSRPNKGKWRRASSIFSAFPMMSFTFDASSSSRQPTETRQSTVYSDSTQNTRKGKAKRTVVIMNRLVKEVNEAAGRDVELCDVCRREQAVLVCGACNFTEPDGFERSRRFCQACELAIHRQPDLRSHAVAPMPKSESTAVILPEYEAVGYLTPLHSLYTVTVIVVIFLVYPTLIAEIARMLRCTDAICVEENDCHPFLVSDVYIRCDTPKYRRYRVLAFIFLGLYGLGVPLLGYIVLLSRRRQLVSTRVMGLYGFLYSGYRLRRYYWEMVIMVRKMLTVVIVVFLAGLPLYQIYFAMWMVSGFLSLNVFLRPWKYRVLWRLENLSLTAVVVSLNLAIVLTDDDLPRWAEGLAVAIILLVNIATLLAFAHRIVAEIRALVQGTFDENGDGKASWAEIYRGLRRRAREGKKEIIARARGQTHKPWSPADYDDVEVIRLDAAMPNHSGSTTNAESTPNPLSANLGKLGNNGTSSDEEDAGEHEDDGAIRFEEDGRAFDFGGVLGKRPHLGGSSELEVVLAGNAVIMPTPQLVGATNTTHTSWASAGVLDMIANKPLWLSTSTPHEEEN
eukprot:TRINITY_DN28150_c0_g1_i2.p1 TRINITY_DN28150_c0_g1~~TRINITY_DN28150_c0_g1_i2.p1  ORF type:complete len:643 (+),score=105.16 TRINITY_DN28150_c0_g1_i2:111-2039(+)